MFPLALVCGNTYVIKPSERDPGACMLLMEMFKEAGAPNGVVNVSVTRINDKCFQCIGLIPAIVFWRRLFMEVMRQWTSFVIIRTSGQFLSSDQIKRWVHKSNVVFNRIMQLCGNKLGKIHLWAWFEERKTCSEQHGCEESWCDHARCK